MNESLTLPPFQDFIVQNSSIQCPLNYEHLQLGIWPGSQTGCLHYVKSTKGIAVCIVTRYAGGPQPIYFWKHQTFCVKRNKRYEESVSGSCKSGMKKCGDNFCVAQGDLCPITSITKTLTRNDLGADYLPFLDGYLEIKRENAATPINKIEYNLANPPCYADGWITNRSHLDTILYNYDCNTYRQL